MKNHRKKHSTALFEPGCWGGNIHRSSHRQLLWTLQDKFEAQRVGPRIGARAMASYSSKNEPMTYFQHLPALARSCHEGKLETGAVALAKAYLQVRLAKSGMSMRAH